MYKSRMASKTSPKKEKKFEFLCEWWYCNHSDRTQKPYKHGSMGISLC